MSLDVNLKSKPKSVVCTCSECGHEHSKIQSENLYWANITHNLANMADKAGIYQACWHPERIPAIKAGEIIPLLEGGLTDLKARPEYFKQFNASNGWGLYEHFVPWVENYLNACRENPDAEIETFC